MIRMASRRPEPRPRHEVSYASHAARSTHDDLGIVPA
jgi:hypothetical protein